MRTKVKGKFNVLLFGAAMKRTALALCLFFVIVAPIILLTQLANSETSTTKPSVPEFTVQIVAYPYDVPTTHSIDPYTGQDITHQGYHVENKSIEVRIKNQPFTPYQIQDSYGNDWTINFYYNIRIKGHFSEDWIELYRADDGYPRQESDSDYSVLSYVLGGDADTILGTKMIKLPAGGQVDFQVEAMIGYVHRTNEPPWYPWRLTGETSGWSSTQTITLPTSGASPTPDQTAEPTTNETSQTLALEAIVGTFIVAVITICIGLVFYAKKRKRQAELK